MDTLISFEDYCNQFTKEEIAKVNEIIEQVYPPNSRIFGTEIHNVVVCALEMAIWKNTQFETLVNSLPESIKQLITDLAI